jgi:hypothetical protein
LVGARRRQRDGLALPASGRNPSYVIQGTKIDIYVALSSSKFHRRAFHRLTDGALPDTLFVFTLGRAQAWLTESEA